MNALPFLQSITFIRFRIIFEAVDHIVLPRYKGSAFRGCLGESLKADTCKHRCADCETCMHRFDCAFSQLFNSYVANGHPHQRKYPKSPHPYIIDPLPGTREQFSPGETFGFDLTLIGSAGDQIQELLRVPGLMGKSGIGKGRGGFKPVSIQSLNPDLEYVDLPYISQPESLSVSNIHILPVGRTVRLTLENPLRLKENGKRLTSAPDFGLLVSRLTQRLGLLAHFYCSAPWPETEIETLPETSAIQISESVVQMVDWRRYSGTQDTTMNFDGLVGHITYEGENLNHWMTLLALGSWLHVGSTATFGLGKYSISG